jgi:predicted dehydrogenase
MSELNFGLIGCGKLGATHADCVAKIDGARFVAYADINEEAARSALDRLGGDYATTDPAKLLSDDRIDAIYICTLHDSHAPLAIAAAKAGKHIMIEKPLALKLEDCEAVAEAVDRSGVVLMPAFKMRYYPLIRRAKEFIPKPMVLLGQVLDRRWLDDFWAQDPIKGGANVHSQGCHITDILRFLAGSEPTQVWAAGGTMTHPGHPCIDQCVASIRFANGCAASWISGDAGLGQFTSKFFFEIYGDNKSVQVYDRNKHACFDDGDKTWVEERPDEEGFQLENEEFVKALTEGRQPELSAHDAIQATRIVLAADKAIRTGEVQDL